MRLSARRLAVLGHPVAHSKSPALHGAAYRVLGLPWEYGLEDVTGDRLADFVRSRDASWRGLSLTMPLKRDVLPLLDRREPLVDIAGGANTLLFADDGALQGFNTDVYGITEAFSRAGVTALDEVQLLGGGATASSMLIAVSRLGAGRVVVSARDAGRAAHLLELGDRIGLRVELGAWADAVDALPGADAVVSTVPGSAGIDLAFPERRRAASVFFDVAYDPWPTPLAKAWTQAGGRVVSGLEMLLHQAVMQVRIFVSGSAQAPLADETAVERAMASAVGL